MWIFSRETGGSFDDAPDFGGFEVRATPLIVWRLAGIVLGAAVYGTAAAVLCLVLWAALPLFG